MGRANNKRPATSPVWADQYRQIEINCKKKKKKRMHLRNESLLQLFLYFLEKNLLWYTQNIEIEHA